MAADLDDDGKIDLFVANDTTANYFFRNQGGFRFAEEGLVSGLAASAAGGYLAGMGVACGDFDGDGRLDLAVTNFFNQSTTLYHNHGGGIFSDRSAEAGLAAPTRPVLGFGLAAPGREQRRLARPGPGQRPRLRSSPHAPLPHARTALSQRRHGQAQSTCRTEAGPPGKSSGSARGLAVGDIDNDGRVDVSDRLAKRPAGPAAQSADVAEPFPHACPRGNHLESRRRRRAGRRHRRPGQPRWPRGSGGGSYLSASDPRLHFGLGAGR